MSQVSPIPACLMPWAMQQESGYTYARPFVKYTPTWPRSFTTCEPENQKPRGEDETDSRTRAD